MAKRGRRSPVDRARYREYYSVAEHFFVAAKDSLDLGDWTAAGVLIVHAAIAYADALCIRSAGEKSSGENHEDALSLLDQVVPEGEEKANALNQLHRIIEQKTKVSYLGNLYTARQCHDLWKRLQRFREWAQGILNR